MKSILLLFCKSAEREGRSFNDFRQIKKEVRCFELP